jgi:hypothetical protein
MAKLLDQDDITIFRNRNDIRPIGILNYKEPGFDSVRIAVARVLSNFEHAAVGYLSA